MDPHNRIQLSQNGKRDKVTVREATHADYETVMKIASPDTFRDGFDYLPAKFQHYVDDPDTLFYIIEFNGEAVQIWLYICMDGGEGALLKTMRLAPKWHGTGLSRLSKQGEQQLLAKLATYFVQRKKVPKATYAVVEQRRKDVRKLLGNEVYSPFKSKVDVMYFGSDLTSLQQQLVEDSMGSLPALVPIQLDNMNQLLQSDVPSTVLARSGGYAFVDWDPYKLNESNMKRFVGWGHHILVDSGKPFAKSLSFGGSYMTPRGRVYHIDVHCTDEMLCKAHIIGQMKHAQNRYTGMMITFCIMLVDEKLKDAVVDLCVKNLQLNHLPHDHTFALLKHDVPNNLSSKY
ncbi:NAT16 [Branchiostoma lanceolatum]|uniref:NAT16 protein n=1 Tax=Branchiostoma lanceolatum TaxID=7740 RepID=A0A8J9VKA0_BRALA|nr:NAT16 [Branchiostoma lanceolatum]